jgi:hypothetical protein
MGTRVLGLGLKWNSSSILIALGLGLESHAFELRLGFDSRHAGLGLGSESTKREIAASLLTAAIDQK